MLNKLITYLALPLLILSHPLLAQTTLKGSRASMERQHQEAIKYGYSFLQTPGAVGDFVNQGYLVQIASNNDLELHDVSYPYARSEVKLFVERLADQYRQTCNERLIVTSLTRPVDKQPANASTESVHPAGMAADLRIPNDNKCRNWLEKTLLSMEKTGVLDVTRERNPAHYHVAVFTRTYENYVAKLENSEPSYSSESSTYDYIIRKGDSLHSIAHRTGTPIEQLRDANRLSDDLIHAGQKLVVPSTNAKAQTTAANTIENSNSAVSTALTVAETALSEPAASPTKSKIKARNKVSARVASAEVTTHKVRDGDTLWQIAMRYGTNPKSLKRTNGLKGDLLQPGQILRIQ